MKKIVVMSDNHGDKKALDYVRAQEPGADFYVHCGDSEVNDQTLLHDFICVRGNNDWSLDLPRFASFQCEELHILVTHGQFYGYFNRELAMKQDLLKHHCEVMISGHSHMPSFKQEGGFTFINPGSTSWPRGGSKRSYCVVFIDGKDVACEFKEVV